MINIYIIDGKNGAGKSFLIDKLVNVGYQKSINYTTRDMRVDEVDGKDYHFIEKDRFEDLIQNGFFVEYQKRGEYYYGTPIENLKDNIILVSSDIKTIKKYYSGNIHRIFIDASLDTRYKRVLKRNLSSRDVFERFNTENFRFLTDFQASFIDNSNDDDKSFESLLKSLETQETLSNKEFIESKIITTTTSISEDEMLSYLQYEEYLLRKLFIDKSIEAGKMLKSYIEQMEQFTRKNGIFFEQIDKEKFHVRLNKEDYYPKFMKGKILK